MSSVVKTPMVRGANALLDRAWARHEYHLARCEEATVRLRYALEFMADHKNELGYCHPVKVLIGQYAGWSRILYQSANDLCEAGEYADDGDAQGVVWEVVL